MQAPVYNGPVIADLETLAVVCDTPVEILTTLIDHSYSYYRAKRLIRKPNGKTRQIYKVIKPLKRLQRKIVDNIFVNVEFPSYLQGALRATNGIRRDYIADALLHAPYRIIMKFDIENFFPSIGYGLVFCIWRDFFRFPPPIAHALARLTTYKKSVPQGASTSSYIANLVFWDKEPQLEAALVEKGFIYTRFIDDINVSSNDYVDSTTKGMVTSKVYGMLRSRGFTPNRAKRRIQTRANKKSIHNLNISAGFPTKDVRVRRKIRAAVKEVEDAARTGCSTEKYEKLHAIASGRVADMRRLHPSEANCLLVRLNAVKPSSKA